MKTGRNRAVVLALMVGLGFSVPSFAVSFQDRLDAQRAIERVYYEQRCAYSREHLPKGPVKSFEETVSDEMLKAKVEKYLAYSERLEIVLGKPLTADQMQREMERMAKETKSPGVLRALFEALHNDPELIAETLARQGLVERLAHNENASDAWFSERTKESGVGGLQDSEAPDSRTSSYTLPLISNRLEPTADCTETWAPTATTDAPTGRNRHVAVWTGSEMIVWGGEPLTSTGGRYYPATDSWSATSLTNAPSGRDNPAVVWTGSKMIVWGGYGYADHNDGGSYDPVADSWTVTSLTNAPTARRWHTAAWTGTEMIVWGGYGWGTWLNTGGQYDPATDSWTATSLTNAPAVREEHTAVWTGTEMIVWGGYGPGGNTDTGGRYDPVTDSWTATSLTDAPAGRNFHTAVWTGTKMIVWGAEKGYSYNPPGGLYDPAADTWSAASLTNVPSGRSRHTAVWTGTKMIVWGGWGWNGASWTSLNTGGLYDPATDIWTATSLTNAPTSRYYHTAIWWPGSEMIVWGGYGRDEAGSWFYYNTGGIYGLGLAAVPPKLSPADAMLYSAGTVSTTIAWNVVSGADFYDYEVSDASCGGALFASGNVAGTSQLITGLSDGTTYWWRLRSVNTCGTSSWSDCWSFSVAIPSVGLVPDGSVFAGSPMTAAAASGGANLQVSWDTATCPATDYNLYYGGLSSVASYTYTGVYCSLGTTSPATVVMPEGNVFILHRGDRRRGKRVGERLERLRSSERRHRRRLVRDHHSGPIGDMPVSENWGQIFIVDKLP